MQGRIRQLFQKKDAAPDCDLPFMARLMLQHEPMRTITKDRLRIQVFPAVTDNCDDCGQAYHVIRFDFLTDRGWEPMLALDERNLRYVTEALDDLEEYLIIAHQD